MYFITMELLIYLLFAICLEHAWRRGWSEFWQLMAGVVFGLLLEWSTIEQFHFYTYGRFLLMLGGVPLAIGVAWGVIIYSARQFSDATSLPEWARPILDGLLALSIDLSMDAIAIRLGFWHWGIDINQQYFGVPYGNFWAWFWVVFFFSTGLRLLTRGKKFLGSITTPLGAVMIGVAGIVGMGYLMPATGSYQVYPVTIACILTGALLLILMLRPKLHIRSEPALNAWVPAAFHGYFLAAGLISGIALQLPILLVISLIMIIVTAVLHWKRPAHKNLPGTDHLSPFRET
jgi:uncharacterized membrane protein